MTALLTHARRRPALALALLLTSWPVSLGTSPALAQSSQYKNLQVLPKNIGRSELKTLMKAQAKALGVDCDFCHNSPNMDEETEHKKLARAMMRMTSELNQKYKEVQKKVTCMTCHHGKEKPSVGE